MVLIPILDVLQSVPICQGAAARYATQDLDRLSLRLWRLLGHRLTFTNIRSGDPLLFYPSGTSPASATRRPRIAAAFPVSTKHSTLPLTPNTRTTPKPRNGSTITILTSLTSCRSNTPSAALRTSATLPRLASPRKNHRDYRLISLCCSGQRPSPDGYEKSRLSSLLGDREASLI